jgi:uncharacterized membrane protein
MAEERRLRRGYLDWARGVGVLLMIEAHVIDAWTRAADRHSWAYSWSLILGGFAAPVFLFLAGVGVSMSAGSKLRRGVALADARHAGVLRGLQIFGLAFLFRIQAWILGGSDPRKLLIVDILNIMGLSMVVAAVLWGLAGRASRRTALLVAVSIAVPLVTPIVRETGIINWLPDPIEAYVRPIRGLTTFALFPWAGFLFAGAVVGLVLDGSVAPASEARAQRWIVVVGAMLALIAWRASFLRSPYAHSSFWTSSPAFFFLRTGLVTTLVACAYWWAAFKPFRGWSPIEQLGRNSLFVYWIHVELVYGLVSLRLHNALSLTAAWLALGAFVALMVLCSIGKDRLIAWRRPIALSPARPT